MKKKIIFIYSIISLSLFAKELKNDNCVSLSKQIIVLQSDSTFYLYEEKQFYTILKEKDKIITETTYNSQYPFSIQKQLVNEKSIFNYLDHEEPTFLTRTNFFSNYFNSNICKQIENFRIPNTSSFVLDINNDNDEEILYFGYPYTGSNPSGLTIYKYIDDVWKEVFSECYFGWDDFYNDKNFTTIEWYYPKIFPYDFIEYKGKIGLRIICYDQPKDCPSHYHAQFWVYDENIKQYEMLEEVWNTEEDTPPDGLIFAEARTNLFTKKDLSYSKLDKKLTDEDIQYLTKDQLRIMRNAIYARHGKTFKSVDLQTLWESYPWYKKNPNYSDDLLTETDKYNIEIIKSYENR